jgi:hypothetical protein
MPDQPLFNVNEGPNGRTGGPYLDEVELRAAEDKRAAAEGRHPDYNNMTSTAGVPLVTAKELVESHHLQPSEFDKPLLDESAVLANADNPDLGPMPLGGSVETEAEEDETEAEEGKIPEFPES